MCVWFSKTNIYAYIYTPQNNLRISSFIFPLFNTEIDVNSFRVNLWAKAKFAAVFDNLNMLAISVAIKMSMVPTRSDRVQKILRKKAISANLNFTPK